MLPPVKTVGPHHNVSAPGNRTGQRSTSHRGGSTRVGKIVLDARTAVTTNQGGGPTGSTTRHVIPTARFLEEGEQRVQQEIIDMLTSKIAKLEKENELYRVQHEGMDGDRADCQAQLERLQIEFEQMRNQLTARVDDQSRELCRVQVQCDQFKEEAETHRIAVHELRRQREKDQVLNRTKERDFHEQMQQIKREMMVVETERRELDRKAQIATRDYETTIARVEELEARDVQRTTQLEQSLQQIEDFQQQVQAAQIQHAHDAENAKKLEEEKQQLDEKLQQMSRSIREVTTRATEAEKRRSDLTHAESQLSKQLTDLHRENEDLRARAGQLAAQTKQLQTKITAGDATKKTINAKLKEAREEVEQARTKCREYQFRIKQLQEEVVFLTNRRQNSIGVAVASTPPSNSAEKTETLPTQIDPACEVKSVTLLEKGTAATENNASDHEATEVAAVAPGTDSIPSWMRD